MSRKQFTILAAVLALGSVLTLPSCGLPQQLDGVSIQPGTGTFLAPDPRLSFNLKAYGLVTVTQAGVATPTGFGCGVVNVLATVTDSPHTPKGQVYIGHATLTVVDTNVPSCPQH